MKLVEGKIRLRIAKEYPYYGTGFRTLFKVIIKDFFGWSVSLWIHHPDSSLGDLSNAALLKLEKMFPGYELNSDGHSIRWKKHTYHPCDMEWAFDSKYDFRATENPQVFKDLKSGKYFGYSHRAIQEFGIGDMLFDANAEINLDELYKNKKYRWKYLKSLIKYHFKNDWAAFEDMCEDTIISHGVLSVVPFHERGRKRIETDAEAFEAASNFANYIS